MRDLSKLGIRPFNRRPFPGFTETELREFERTFGVKLPADYVEFIGFANGGTLDYSHYLDPATGALGSINDFYGLGSRRNDEIAAVDGKWDFGNLWGETRIFRIRIGHSAAKTGVPIAEDAGSNQIFFEFLPDSMCVSRLVASTQRAYKLTPSFANFLDLLRPRTPRPAGKHQVRFNLPDE